MVGAVMTRYAESTTVSAERSRGEIERILSRYGADSFLYGWEGSKAVIQFRVNDKYIQFILEMPSKDNREFTHTPVRGNRRSPAQTEAAWEQATRQRWRALALVIKAKLEAVGTGITEFESEFLAHIVLPNGQTVGNWILPQIQMAYDTGDIPKMLPMGDF